MYLYLFEFVWRRSNPRLFDAIINAMATYYGDDMPYGDARQEFIDRCMTQRDTASDALHSAA